MKILIDLNTLIEQSLCKSCEKFNMNIFYMKIFSSNKHKANYDIGEYVHNIVFKFSN